MATHQVSLPGHVTHVLNEQTGEVISDNERFKENRTVMRQAACSGSPLTRVKRRSSPCPQRRARMGSTETTSGLTGHSWDRKAGGPREAAAGHQACPAPRGFGFCPNRLRARRWSVSRGTCLNDDFERSVGFHHRDGVQGGHSRCTLDGAERLPSRERRTPRPGRPPPRL